MNKLNRFAPGMKTMAASLLALALLAAPCHAVTAVESSANAPALLQQGVIQQISSGTLRIGDKAYLLSASTANLFDRNGKPLTAARLAVGKTVAISVVQDGSQLRIKQLWLID